MSEREIDLDRIGEEMEAQHLRPSGVEPEIGYLLQELAGRRNVSDNPGVDREDLIQDGHEEVLRTLLRHPNTSSASRLATIAWKGINGRMVEAIRKGRGTLGDDDMRALRSVRAAEEVLLQILGRQPSFSEIAERIGGISVERIASLKQRVRGFISLDKTHHGLKDEDGELTLGEYISDGSEPVDVQIERKEVMHHLKEAIMTLSPRELRVTSLYFSEGLTQHDIAEEMGVSRQKVGQILDRAISKLRKVLSEQYPELQEAPKAYSDLKIEDNLDSLFNHPEFLNTFSERERIALTEFYVENKTGVQIAREWGISQPTFSAILVRARKKAQALMLEYLLQLHA